MTPEHGMMPAALQGFAALLCAEQGRHGAAGQPACAWRAPASRFLLCHECFTVFVVLSAVHRERRQFEFALLLDTVCRFHSTGHPPCHACAASRLSCKVAAACHQRLLTLHHSSRTIAKAAYMCAPQPWDRTSMFEAEKALCCRPASWTAVACGAAAMCRRHCDIAHEHMHMPC